jgi:Putative transposase of IS4/5 family (DUF4096)
LVVERNVEAILHWSTWRRWHQAWARYYHYRRRQSGATERATPEGEVRQAQAQQVDVIEVVWKRLERLLPPARRTGRPYSHHRRLVLEAIVYLKQTNCGWHHLPSRFPPCQTVYSQLRRWRESGIWDKIWAGLNQPLPTNELQL